MPSGPNLSGSVTWMMQYTYLPRRSAVFCARPSPSGSAGRAGSGGRAGGGPAGLFRPPRLLRVFFVSGHGLTRPFGLADGGLPALQHPADLRDQLIRQAGLGEERVAARLLRAPGVARQRVAGERDHRDLPGALVGLEPAGRFPAVHHRQREIHDDDVRHPGLSGVDGFLAVLRLDHLIPREAEVLGVHLAVVGEVVHDQDERLAGVGRAHRRFPRRGITSVKVEPLASSDSSSMRPSSMAASLWQMARPRPAPPYARVTELSAWRKSSKTLA